jgi:hypothetical protein
MSTIDQYQNDLASVDSRNPDVTEAAAQIHQYTEMCKAGQISREEYIQLIKDIQSQLNVNEHLVEQQNLVIMNTAINGLVQIASLA